MSIKQTTTFTTKLIPETKALIFSRPFATNNVLYPKEFVLIIIARIINTNVNNELCNFGKNLMNTGNKGTTIYISPSMVR